MNIKIQNKTAEFSAFKTLIMISAILSLLSLNGLRAEEQFNDNEAQIKELSSKNQEHFEGFWENKGQVADQNGKARQDVQFIYSHQGFKAVLLKNAFSYELYSFSKNKGDSKKENIDAKFKDLENFKISSHRIDIELLNSNPEPTISVEGKSDDYNNFVYPWCPKEGANFVYNYQKVTYKNIYPNIDLVFSVQKENSKIKNRTFKYDFILHPGANAADIKMKYKGADSISKTADGNIKIYTSQGELEEIIPVSYILETGEKVAVEFILNGNELSFQEPAYDKGKTLVIDPVAQRKWGTYYGGASEDNGYKIAIDSENNIYLVGYTNSQNNIASNGAYISSKRGFYDAFLAKFSPDGRRRLWGTYYGGSNSVNGNSHTVGYNLAISSGYVYIVGSTNSTNVASNSSVDGTLNGASDGFIAKFNVDGTFNTHRYFGGMDSDTSSTNYGTDNIYGIKINGNYIYIVGSTESDSLLATSPYTYSGGERDAFVAKLNTNLVTQWCRYFGGDDVDDGYDVTYDITNNYVVIVGTTMSSSGIYYRGEYTTIGGGNDAFIAIFSDSDGLLQYGTYYGGNSDDIGFSCFYDNSCYYIGGLTQSNNINSSNTYSGSAEGFIAKFYINNYILTRSWGRYVGSTGYEFIKSIFVKNFNSSDTYLYILGMTNSTTGIKINCSDTLCYDKAGDYDYFLQIFPIDGGSPNFGRYYGSTGEIARYEFMGGIVVDNFSNISICGTVDSLNRYNRVATANSWQDDIGSDGYRDAFVAKFSTQYYINIESVSPATLCAGQSFNVVYSTGFDFNSDNVFTAQISNNGFSTITSVGTLSSTGAGTITCTVPYSISSSGAYTLRIISSNPADTSNTRVMQIYSSSNPTIVRTDGRNVNETCRDQKSYEVATASSYSWSIQSSPYNISFTGQNTNRIEVNYVDIPLTASYPFTVVLSVVVTNGPCTLTDAKTITVYSYPSTPTIAGPNNFCSTGSGTYSITNNYVNGSTVYWELVNTSGTSVNGNVLFTPSNSSNIASTVTINYNGLGTGTYYLRAQQIDHECYGAPSNALTINISQAPNTTILGRTSDIYPGCPYTYASSVTTGITGYTWSIDQTDGTTFTGQGTSAITVTWGTYGGKSISLVVENNEGCTFSTSPYNVNVYTPTLPSITTSPWGTTTACVGATTNFQASNGSGYTWSVQPSTICNTASNYGIGFYPQWANSGTATITVISRNADGCEFISNPYTINIIPLPQTSITGQAGVCEGQTGVAYTVGSGFTSYQWVVTGGTITTSAPYTNSILVNWGLQGTGSVAVTVTNSYGCQRVLNINNISITRLNQPTLTGNQMFCVGTTGTVFSTNSTDMKQWSCTGCSSSSSDGQNFTVNWGNTPSTNARVSLTVTTTGGCSSSRILPVTLLAYPTPSISGSPSVCSNTSATYSVTNIAGHTYSWSVVEGPVTINNPTLPTITASFGTVSTATTCRIGLTETVLNSSNQPLCSSYTFYYVTINPYPTPTINSGPHTVCAEDAGVNYQVSNVNSLSTYTWTIPSGGAISGSSYLPNVQINIGSTAGIYTLFVTETLNGCSGTSGYTIQVKPRPNPSVSGDNDVCAGESRTYNADNTISGSTFLWEYSSNAQPLSASGNPNMIILWNSPGEGYVRVTEFNNGCSRTTINYPVTVNAIPTPSIVGQNSVCAGASGVLYTCTLNSGSTYNWSVTNGSIMQGQGTNSILVNWGNTSPGLLMVQETRNGCVGTASYSVSINQPVVPQIDGRNSVCKNTTNETYSSPTPANSYLWNVVGGTYSGSGNSINVNWGNGSSGLVSLTIVDNNGCTTFSTKNITLNDIPNPQIDGSFTVCAGDLNSQYHPVQVFSGSTYTWSVSGGYLVSPQNDPTVGVNWGENNYGILTLEERNLSGCYSVTSVTVTIYPIYRPQIAGTNVVCAEQRNVIYTTASHAGSNYNWYVEGGTPTTYPTAPYSISVNWGSGTSGKIKVTEYDNSLCPARDSIIVQINPLPSPIISGNADVCEDGFETYSSNSTSGTSNYWNVQGGTLSDSTSNSITVHWGLAGNGAITLTQVEQSTGCQTFTVRPVTINILPTPVLSGAYTVCQETLNTYTITTGVHNLATKWSCKRGTIVGADNSDICRIIWSNAGVDTIKVVQENINLGCKDSSEIIITIAPLPDVTINGSTLVCALNVHTYTTAAESNTGISWSASGGSISGADNQSIVVVNWGNAGAGTLTLIKNNTQTGCRDTNTINVTISNLPTPTISGPYSVCRNSTVLYSATLNTGIRYNWSVGGGTYAGRNDTYTFLVNWGTGNAGTVKLVQTVDGGTYCSDSLTINITINPLPTPNVVGPVTVCAMTSGAEYSTVFASTSAYTWGIEGGVITTENYNRVTVNWGNSATGKIWVTERNAFGCIQIDTLNVHIDTLPNINISGNLNVCVATVHLYSATTPSGTLNNWSVDGGTVINTASDNITVRWNTQGNGSVTLTQIISETGCTTFSVYPVTITDKPEPDFTGLYTVCQNTVYTYTISNDITNLTSQWLLKYGTKTERGNTVEIIWSNAVTDTLQLIQTNNLTGCKDTISKAIFVNPLPNVTITGSNSVCANNIYSYSATSESGVNYLWTANGGTINGNNNQPNVTVQWGSGSVGTLQLTKSYPTSGCSTFSVMTVTINPLPVVGISGTTFVCAGSTQTYTTSSGTNLIYKWEVTGGTKLSNDNTDTFVVEWGTGTNGSIKLIKNYSDGNQCKDSTEISVTINPLPTPDISGSLSVCQNQSGVGYQTQPNAGSSYVWEKDGIVIQSGNNSSVSINWGIAGTSKIKVTETNIYGCSKSDSIEVTIEPLPQPTLTGNFTVCENSVETYSSNNPAGIVNVWNVNGGTWTSNGNNITVNWGSAANGSITLTQSYTTSGCTTFTVYPVTLNPLPEPDFTGLYTVCQNTVYTYTISNNTTNLTSQWSLKYGTKTERGNTVEIIWSNAVTDTLQLIQTNNLTGCKDTIKKAIFVNPLPNVNITGSNSVCANNTYSYSATVESGVNYLWSANGGTINGNNNQPNVSVQWGIGSVGTLQLTKSYPTSGCSTFSVMTVTIEPLPVVGISGTTFVCAGSTQTYTTSSASNLIYKWEVNGGTKNGNDNTNTFVVEWGTGTNGSIKLIKNYTDGNQCKDSTEISVTINPLPTPDISGSLSVCQNQSGVVYQTQSNAGSSYVWEKDGVVIQTGSNSSVSVNWGLSGRTKIKVTETNIYGCSKSDSIEVTIEPLPQPTLTGNFTVCENSVETYSSNNPAGIVNIWNVSGGTWTSNGNNLTVNWGSSANGSITLTQTYTTSGCTTFTVYPVTLNPLPEPDFTGLYTVCQNTVYTYTISNDITNLTSQWSLKYGTKTERVNTVEIIWSNAVTDTLQLIQTNNLTGCKDTISKAIFVNPLPNVTITGSNSVCANNIYSYSATTESGVNYLWSANGGTINGNYNQPNVSVQWGIGSVGTLQLTKSYPTSGCSTFSVMTVTIEPLPVVGISGTTFVCAGSTQTYTTSSASNLIYKWEVNGGTKNGNDNTNTFVVEWGTGTNGSIKLIKNYSDGNQCKDSTEISVTINPLPTPDISGSLSVCQNQSGVVYQTQSNAGSSYVWEKDGVVIQTGSNSSVSVNWGLSGRTKIKVTETNIYGCSKSDSIEVTIEPLPQPTLTGNFTVCENSVETYSSNSPAGIVNVWNVSGGTWTSNGNNLTVNWGSSANGSITLTQSYTTSGCTTFTIYPVTLNPLPEPDFMGLYTVCQNTVYTYTISNDITNLTSQWSLKYGTKSERGNTVEIIWSNAVTDTLQLIQTNNLTGCKDTISKAIFVNPLPNVTITGSNSVCANNIYSYSATVESGVNYLWSANGGTINGSNNQPNVSVQWGSGSVGTLQLTKSYPTSGCSTFSVMTVTINPLPVVGISGTTFVCAGSTQTYTTSSASNLIYKWEVNGGTKNGNDNTNTFVVEWGTGTNGSIKLIKNYSDGNQCKDSTEISVTINPLPTPDISGSLSVCQNQSGVVYQTQSNAGSSYVWEKDGVVIQTGSNSSVSVNWGLSGRTKIKVTETNVYGCSKSDSIEVTIEPLPQPTLTGNFTVCENSVETYSSNNPAGIVNVWNVNGGTWTSNGNILTVNWGSSANGSITLTQSYTTSGCTTFTVYPVTLNPLPEPDFTGLYTVCQNTVYTYTISNDITNLTSQWSLKYGTKSERGNTVEIIWSNAVNDTLQLIQTNNLTGCKDTISKAIFVNPLPNVTITGSNSVCANNIYSYSATTESGVNYLWSANGGTINGNNNQPNVSVQWGSGSVGTLQLTKSYPTSGCSTFSVMTVTIEPLPVVGISGTTFVCAGSTQTYTTSSASNLIYKWEVNGGTKNGNDNTNTFVVEWGTGTNGSIKLIKNYSDGNQCKDSTEISVTINPLPTPDISGSLSVCQNQSGVVYQTQSNAGSSYVWEKDGVIIQTGNNSSVSVNWGLSGRTKIKVTETNVYGCSKSDSIEVTIEHLPQPTLTGNFTVCENSVETYSSNNPAGIVNIWNVSGGTWTSNGNNLTVNWGSSANGSITLTQSYTTSGCTTFTVYPVTLNPLPEPDFTGLYTVCQNTVYTYTTSNNTTNLTSQWSLKYGTKSERGNTVEIIWSNAVTDTLQLIQTNNLTGCKDTISKAIFVNPLPNVTITGSNSVCANNTYSYSATVESGVNYLWSANGGTINGNNNQPNVTVQWGIGSVGTLQLTKSYPTSGCSTFSVMTVTIEPLPVVGISGTTFVCAGSTQTYTTSSASNLIYKWEVNGGTKNGNDNTNTFVVEWGTGTNGSIKLIKNYTDGNQCKDSTEISVTINPLPTPDISGSLSVCQNQSGVVYQTQSNAGSSYVWEKDGVVIQTGSNSSVSVNWGLSGRTKIKVTETNIYGCSKSDSIEVTIEPLPVVSIDGVTNVCANNLYVYTTAEQSGVSMAWTVTGGTAVGATNQSEFKVQWGNSGIGTVKLIKTNSNGCKDSLTTSVTINNLPSVTITGSNQVCANNIYLYTTTTESNIEYKWSVSGISGTIQGRDDQSSVRVLWNDVSTATLTLVKKLTNSSCTDSSKMNIRINSLPTVSIQGLYTVCMNNATLYSTTSAANLRYEWFVPSSDGEIKGTANSSSVTVVWKKYGTSVIKLIKTDNVTGCKDSLTQNIVINPLPTVTIDGLTNICANNLSYYTTTLQGNETIKWKVSGGVIQGKDNEKYVTVLWGGSGIGTIKLYKTNATACSDSLSKDVTIYELPKITITGANTVCTNCQEYYLVNDDPSTSNAWSVSGGKIIGDSNLPNLTVKWGAIGTGYIKVVKTNTVTGCKDSAMFNVRINESPTAGIAGPFSVCENSTEAYATTSNPNIKAEWSIQSGDGTIVGSNTGSMIYVKWGKAGKAVIKLVISIEDKNYKDSITQEITINELPKPTIDGSLTVCGSSLEIYQTTENPDILNEWFVVGGTPQGATNTSKLSVKWDPAGTGKITLIQTNKVSLCKDSLVKTVLINPLPDVQFNLTKTRVCLNEPEFDIETATPAGGDFTGNGVANNRFNPANAGVGTFEIKYTFVDGNGCSNSVAQTITVLPRPTKPTITQIGLILKSTSAAGYQWYRNTTPIQDATEELYSPDESDFYYVLVTDANGCVSEMSDPYYFDASGKPTPILFTNTSVSFDTLFCDYEKIDSIAITNKGKKVLSIYDAEIIGTNPNEFTLIDNITNVDIDTGATKKFAVRFNPGTSGIKVATLKIHSNAKNDTLYKVALWGRKEYVGFTLSETTVDFSNAEENTPITATIKIINTGTVPLLWTAPVTIGKFIIEDISPIVTPPNNGESVVTIKFVGGPQGSSSNATYPFTDRCNRTIPLEMKAVVGTNPSATIQIGDMEAKPGEIVHIPVYLRDPKNMDQAKASKFTATLKFNCTLLQPVDGTPQGIVEKGIRTINIDIPLESKTEGLLTVLKFKASLGNDTITDLNISDLKADVGKMNLTGWNGKFYLKGVCYEGGIRLITKTGEVKLCMTPNPVSDVAQIKFDVVEKGTTRIYLVNSLGQIVTTVYEGVPNEKSNTLQFVPKNIPSGNYLLIMDTPTDRRTISVMVTK